jgi:hypothetical protein
MRADTVHMKLRCLGTYFECEKSAVSNAANIKQSIR